jgi:hypothetical protein
MEQQVAFPEDKPPTWKAVSTLLSQCSFPVQIRMINGELAFPGEEPTEPWREVRVSTMQGMVTVRREAGHIILVTWGNADKALVQAWNALTWAFAEAGDGCILTPSGSTRPSPFRETADLPPVLGRQNSRRD